MKPHYALLVFWYFLETLSRCSAIPICLTWNTSNTHLTVKCSVMSANTDIVIIDPVGKVRAQCMGESKLCQRSTTHGTTLPFTTSKDDTEGEWTCRHGKEEKTSEVSYTKSISSMIDIDISAEHWKLNEGYKFNITCFSCWIPHIQGVDIFVNDVAIDSIRYQGDECIYKHALCKPEKCTCAANGQKFTWTHLSALQIVQFACEMWFRDEIKETTFKKKAELTFNGKDTHNSDVDKIDSSKVGTKTPPDTHNSDVDKIDSSKVGTKTPPGNIKLVALGIFGPIILALLIICYIDAKIKKNKSLKQ